MDEHGGEQARRAVVRRMDRERLLRYVVDIIKKQNTPLCDIVRDHALNFLPAQSLCRFRSVSSSWNARISAPFFAHTQSHAHRSLSGLFYEDGHLLFYLPFNRNAHAVPDPFLRFLPDAVHVTASSNGLVACRSRGLRYYVCNPATTHWTVLPPSIHRYHHPEVALVFQPSALEFSPHYLLVCPLNQLGGLEVFSSKTGDWSSSHSAKSTIPAEAWGRIMIGPAVAVGGVAYWRTSKGSVVSYDSVTDILRNIGRAPAAEKPRWQLGEMDGRLCCVGAEKGKVEVHALEHGGSAWHKMGCFEVTGDPWPLAFQGKERQVVLWMDGMVVIIDLRSGTTKVVGSDVPQSCATNGVPYISSLTSVPKSACSY